MEDCRERTAMGNELWRVIKALPGLVWTARPDGHIDFPHQRWRQYAGLPLQEASGWGWRSVIHPEDLPKLVERWQSYLASGKPVDTEARKRRSDGVDPWFLIHHGRIWASSNDGPGARFSFPIPGEPEEVPDAGRYGDIRTSAA